MELTGFIQIFNEYREFITPAALIFALVVLIWSIGIDFDRDK